MSEALTLIGIVVGSAAFGIVFAEFAFIHVKNWQVKKRLLCVAKTYEIETVNESPPALRVYYIPRRLKPFDCHLCMSFWVCLCLCLFYLHLPVVDSILTAATSCLFSVWVWKQIKP